MKYLLILFVIALALAPLSHFFPSKRQRLVARLRESAAIHGLFVEFRDLPSRGSGEHLSSSRKSAQVIYYGKRLAPSRNKPRSRLAWLPDDDSWRGVDHREEAPIVSENLPAAVQALGVDEASCGIFWQEEGDEGDVDQIVQSLEAWAEQLSA